MEITQALMTTAHGVFTAVAMRDDAREVIALLYGVQMGVPLVRIQSACLPSAVFKSTMCDCQTQVEAALRMLQRSSFGIMIYLPYQEARGHGLFGKIEVMKCLNRGLPLREAQAAAGRADDLRSYEDVVILLKALEVYEIDILGNRGAKTQALENGGIFIRATHAFDF